MSVYECVTAQPFAPEATSVLISHLARLQVFLNATIIKSGDPRIIRAQCRAGQVFTNQY